MLLDVTKTGSKYYSHKKFVADSTMNAEIQKQLKSTPGSFNFSKRLDGGNVAYSVEKTYPDFKVTLFQSISSDAYAIEEDEVPQWKILPEKEKIGAYEAQKAETEFGGRKWTAWFSSEIPIQDGPYKFYGLPGLIVKIEDYTGTHTMTLVGNKTFIPSAEEEISMPSGMVTVGIGGKPLKINEKQFRKLWKEYTNDPAKKMRQTMMQSSGDRVVSIRMRDSSGKEISDPAAIYRTIEENVKRTLKKNNNPIEPELYR